MFLSGLDVILSHFTMTLWPKGFLGLHVLVFVLTSTVACGTLYKQALCVLGITSKQLSLSQVDSSQLLEDSR